MEFSNFENIFPYSIYKKYNNKYILIFNSNFYYYYYKKRRKYDIILSEIFYKSYNTYLFFLRLTVVEADFNYLKAYYDEKFKSNLKNL